MRYSTSIGIDTHSKKNAICAIITSASAGEMCKTILSEDPARLVSWIKK